MNKKLNISAVLTKYNKNDLEEIFTFAQSLKSKFVLIPLLITGREQFNNLDIDISEKISIVKKLFQLDKNNIFKPIFPRAFYFSDDIKREDIYSYCSFPYIVGITPDSSVYPCEGLRNIAALKLGNLNKSKLEDIWFKSKIISRLVKIKTNNLKGVCKRCKYREECGGGCRASAYLRYRDFRMPDPLCQEAYKKGIFPKKALKLN